MSVYNSELHIFVTFIFLKPSNCMTKWLKNKLPKRYGTFVQKFTCWKLSAIHGKGS